MRINVIDTIENSEELRLSEMARIDALPVNSKQDEMIKLLVDAWGEWVPDYEGWLKWSDKLYSADAVINAIDGEKKFRDYQLSMKDQRDRCSMKMGPIIQAIADENTVALVYRMYLTPKGMENAPTFSMMITEYNYFEEIDGQLKVTRLDLYTDGGNLR